MIQRCSIWKVFREFLNNPDQKMHVRQISKKVGLAPTSVKLHIGTLLKEGMIREDDSGIFKGYLAQFDNGEFRFYKRINILLSLQESGLIEFLDTSFTPSSIVLFGSAAKGEDTSTRDIDIFIESSEKKVDVSLYEKKMNRKIQLFASPHFHSLPKELRNNIANGIKLEGYLKVY